MARGVGKVCRDPSVSRVAVAARSFVRNATLCAELRARHPDAKFSDGISILAGAALVDFLKGAERAIIGLELVDNIVLGSLPELKVISKYGVGLDGLDLDALSRHGVKLAWTGGLNRRSVAELTLGFAIALVHRVPEAGTALKQGDWLKLVGRQLSERSVGIIGCGFVGKELVRLLSPLGSRVLVNDIRNYEAFYAETGVEPVSLDRLLAESDIVTLHVPLDRSTVGMIGRVQIAKMKKGACLINAARGGLVDEAALAEALSAGHLAGAACDVFQSEPDVHPALLGLPTFLGTPHIGGSTEEAQLAMGRAAIEGLENAREITDDWPLERGLTGAVN